MVPVRIALVAMLAISVAACAGTEGPKTKAAATATATTQQVAKAPAATEKKPMEAAPTQITTEKQFREMIVGKRAEFIKDSANWATSTADGRLIGEWKGKKMNGTWSWEESFYCRTVSIGDKDLGRNCQKVVIDGDVVTWTRDRGEGRASKWRLSE